MLRLFRYDHLPDHLQEVSKPFHDLAADLIAAKAAALDGLAFDAEVLVADEYDHALRRLLEAKDCAVRAVVLARGR